MRIQEIVLDGFKSYASRTVITGFDEHFNAITGYNGSGKSNILDAICFVLGISTLSTVRVANKQELIYKNGQAGIVKANVTILFDNSDKTRCHEAYKKYDTISVRREYAVGGASKCTINGTTVTNDKLLQLFSMSGLNVNNANFLIMQGRITQVINMKPSEILSLVEETAGTNAYEEIKKRTVKLVEKKDAKLLDIDNILNNEVIPIMEQLKKENEDYLRWRGLCQELETLERKVKAATYYELREMLMNTETIQKNYADVLKDLENKGRHLTNQIKELERQKNELCEREARLVPECDKRKLDELKQKKDVLDAQINRKKTEQSDWESKKAKCINEIEAVVAENKLKNNYLLRANEEVGKGKESVLEAKKYLESLKLKLQALDSGELINENFTETRIQDLVRKKEALLQDAEMKSDMIKGLQKKLQLRTEELIKAKGLENFDFTAIDKEISDLTKRISSIKGYSEEDIANMEAEKSQLEQELFKINKTIERYDDSKFACNYNLPEPNFDRTRVKGRVIKLIKLKEEKYARALEAGVGSRLYSVIVDTDVTGQILLNKKSFGNVSIFSINKTVPNITPEEKVRRVAGTFGNKARLALDLIEYSQEIRNPICYIFGSFFVCETKEIAEKIAYDNNFRCTAVTLEGDTYSPSGTMSGGESNNKPSALSDYCKYQEQEKRLQGTQKKLGAVRAQLQEVEKQKDALMALQNDLDIRKMTRNSKEISMKESSVTKITNEIQEIQGVIELNDKNVKEGKKEATAIEKEIQTLKRQSTGNPRDDLVKTIAKAESEVKKATELVKRHQGDINELESALESNQKTLEENQEKIQGLQQKLEKNSKGILELTNELSETNAELQQVKVVYDTKLHEQIRHREVLDELNENLKKYSGDLTELNKEQSSIESKRKALQKDSDSHLKTLEELEAKHPYIASMESEIQNFDKVHAKEQLLHLQSECERQSKRINKKVSTTLDDHQKRYTSLTSKRTIVNQDKGKLLEIIQDLDEKKQICIEQTWRKVDTNLGEIYSMLLPGAAAKLESTDELKGLEMKVGFNGDWKSNLGELSGGQRSLLALSFILALLKVNPAPVYILDEIDAALDMSHTQNIGLMLSTHFSQSQFIVVSLKEGMFTNANVLFRTQFVDGRSVVEKWSLNSSNPTNRSKNPLH